MNTAAAAHARDVLDRLEHAGALRPLDVELGRLMQVLAPHADPALAVAGAAVSQAVAQGHTCLPLDNLRDVLAAAQYGDKPLPRLPDVDHLRTVLRASALVGGADSAADARLPLWLDASDRLYLGRHFHYEGHVARVIRRLAAQSRGESVNVEILRAFLGRHLPSTAELDWQAVAVATGLASALTIITGGPGTGKTTTVLWLLAALIEQAHARGAAIPRIALAAPTGKAAARLGESLRSGLARMQLDDAVRVAALQPATTLHHLLGVYAGSGRFRHDHANPLEFDMVVVDEASMVDLPLMAKLLDALPEQAALVLLGDRDQLASVEAGNVLAGLCAAAGVDGVSAAQAQWLRSVTHCTVPESPHPGPLADHVVALRKSHRFGADSGLGQLAARVRAGDAKAVLAGLREKAFTGVDRVGTDDPQTGVLARVIPAYAALAACADAAGALQQAVGLRVLTALREGPSGCIAINAAIEQVLRQEAQVSARTLAYRGRLIMVTENDAASGLFNGDIGILWPDAAGRLAAWFPDAAGGVRALPRQALPAHESAFAMTIHKSQGSEFDEVLIVLPPVDARVLGRELLYTAITRARRAVHLLAGESILEHASVRSTRRFSGLADRLLALPSTLL